MDTVDAPQIIEHQNRPLTYTPYDVRWVPCSARMVTMGMYPRGTGVIQVFEMRVGALNVVAEVRHPWWTWLSPDFG
jgi:WD repeat-containing protein 92